MPKFSFPLVVALLLTSCGGSPPEGYTIVEDSRTGSTKRSVEVVLDEKVGEDELRQIASRIKSDDGRNYERTFIGYHVKQKVDSGYWATTHYNPDLEVKILGLSEADEESLKRSEPAPAGRQILGTWLDEGVGSKVILYKDKVGKLFIENSFPDGSTWAREMAESQGQRGKRLEDIRGNDFGEYYVVNSANQLEYWSKDGNYYTAKSIK